MVLLWMRPSAKTDESSHTFSMMVRIPFRDRAIWKLRGWWREMGGIFCVAFIVAFQEFDLAACMNARSWTIALFDAQSGGLALGDSLRMMLWPFAVECVALGGIWLHSHSGQPRQTRDLPQRSVQPVILPLAVCIALIAIPLSAPLLFLRGGWSGLMSLENFALIREVANSFLLALVAATGAWLLAGWALQNRTRTMLLALPGLLGGLIVSLGLLTLFQLPPLHLLRASPLPVLVALVLQILPAALFLRWILNQGQQSEAAHIARENGSGALIWTILRRPALWGGGLLFLQAYGDFTANSLLAPPALTSAFSRIFNLLHYGQTAVLSAMLLITLAVPVVALFIATLVVRLHAIRRTA
jgi:ABC-type Fe3+ transport system permease subunit